MAKSKKSASKLLESYMGYQSLNSLKYGKILLIAYLSVIGMTFLFCAYMFSGFYGNSTSDKDSRNLAVAIFFFVTGAASLFAVYKIIRNLSKK